MRKLRLLRRISILAFSATLTGALLPSCHGSASAQDRDGAGMQNLAVVSLSGYDEILTDLKFLGDVSGKPNLDQLVEQTLNLFTQGQGLAGLDKSRPWGVVVRTDTQQFVPLAFVPTTDLKQLLEVLALLGIEAEPTDGGFFQLEAATPAGPQALFLRESGDWTYIAQTPEALEQAPADPLPMLDGLNDTYDVAIRLYVQNVPPMFRQMAIDQLAAGMQQGLQQADDDSTQSELQRRIAEGQLRSIRRMIEETHHITVGWNIDSQEQKTHIDLALVAIEGTELAGQVADLHDTRSAFTGFLSDTVAAGFNVTSKYPPEEAQQMAAMLDAVQQRAIAAIDEDVDLAGDERAGARKTLKEVLDQVIGVLKATVETGTMDGGMLLQLASDSVTVAGGVELADAAGLEGAIRRVVELAEGEPDFPEIRWDADTHQGVRFHTTRVRVPEDEDLRKILGDEMDAVVGVGDRSFYVALGPGSLDTLKAVIDASQTGADRVVPPVRMRLSLATILQFAAFQVDDPRIASVAEQLRKSGGNDHVHVTARAFENGFVYRIEVEEGVLQAIGAISGGP